MNEPNAQTPVRISLKMFCSADTRFSISGWKEYWKKIPGSALRPSELTMLSRVYLDTEYPKCSSDSIGWTFRK